MSKKKVLFDYHDSVLGHILLNEIEGEFRLYIGNRDISFKNGEKTGSGMFLCDRATYPDCRQCVLGDDKGDLG